MQIYNSRQASDTATRCETCVHYLPPAIEVNEFGERRLSKWHRCERFAVLIDREKPGREKGTVLAIECAERTAQAPYQLLHVAPFGVCECWRGHDGAALTPEPATVAEQEERMRGRLASRVVNAWAIYGNQTPEEDRDGWGLRRLDRDGPGVRDMDPDRVDSAPVSVRPAPDRRPETLDPAGATQLPLFGSVVADPTTVPADRHRPAALTIRGG